MYLLSFQGVPLVLISRSNHNLLLFIISEVCLSMPLQAAFVGAMAIADLVKTTLGPKGMVRSQHGATCLFAGLSTLRDRIALS